ncbi:hypothetical protein [Portibacter lacus]|uniref:Uncharacterized protein n=1 Tax=Portibacter lacus TaxID=1099794 RepID=A0AA37ST16_9BACT|nr:hypothetical protein [Portibacter lacus]GLR19129.1 hypothetical protein GCM10007940_37450 [Portibacter lacus]
MHLFVSKRRITKRCMSLPVTIFSILDPGDYVYEFIETLDYKNGGTIPVGETLVMGH